MKLKFRIISTAVTLILALCLVVPISTYATFTNPITTNSNYDRTAAFDYMTSYTINRNTAYPDYSGPLGGDCTNFASQILYAGGMSFTSRTSNPDYNYWYYYYDSWGMGRTATWPGAHEFRQHWADVNGVGKKRAYRFTQYTIDSALQNFHTIYNDVWAGDIIQRAHVSTGKTYHSEPVYRFPAYDCIDTAEHSGSNGNGFYDLESELQVEQNRGFGNDLVCVIQIKYGN